jgi:hypothetical protein
VNERFSRERLAGYDEGLVDRRLLILGAGALGDALSIQLSMWGFSRATIVDFDAYEASNATRVLDFPHARVRAGEHVHKAEHVAERWRARLDAAGLASGEIGCVVGYAQEVAPAAWSSADVVVAAVDHPRARHDVAVLARRYGKPVVMGGFDAASRALSIEQYPARPDAACQRCTLEVEPTYAAIEMSCTARGRRELEARRVPATPTLAAACASVMVQRIVDGLSRGFPDTATLTQVDLAPRIGASAGMYLKVERDPACPMHEDLAALEITVSGPTLGDLLRALERALPGAAVAIPGGFPVYLVTDDTEALVRVTLPAWRCPATVRARDFPAAPAGATSLVLDEIGATLAGRLHLGEIPASFLGLGPGARAVAVAADGTRRSVHVAS